jgi:putative flippase GtrA
MRPVPDRVHVSHGRLLRRIASRRAAILLWRNTAVSSATFLFGLTAMWVLVEMMGANKVFAAAISFLAATSLHYVFGRHWIFRGTDRTTAAGYGYFLINAGIGLSVTVSLFAALVSWTSMSYLVARIIVSAFAGLVMFLLNAMLNFKQL